MRLIARAALGVVVAWLLLGPIATGAAAHALLTSSDPPAGASLSEAPNSVTITFTETPDPKLSSIRVLDSTGAPVAAGPTQVVPGAPTELTVSLPALQPGVYTVSWRTLSTVDGHLATGSYAFGIGVAPPPASGSSAGSVAGSSQLTVLGIAGRWLLYAGLIVLLGVCWMLLRGAPGPVRWPSLPDTRPIGPMVGLSALAAALGTVMVMADQIINAGVSLGDLAGTSLGSAALLRSLPFVPAVIAFALIARRHTSRAAIILLGIAALGGMTADVALSHAAAGGQPLFDSIVQWLHIVAAGGWLGGLACLAIWLRRRAPDETAVSVMRRFSRVATEGLALIVVTGVLRAISEVGTLDNLLHTDFGAVVIAKSVLLLALALLGAVNHFVSVPRGLSGLPLLKRVGPAELGIATVIALLSASLVNLAPPAEGATSAAPQNVVVSADDYGTTVHGQLTVDPGTAGFDTFALVTHDFDSGALVVPDSVALRFALPAKPDVGGSRLDLDRQSDGSYSAQGTNLSIDGTWTITAVISRGTTAVEVPFKVTTRIVRQPVDISSQPGLPTIYIVHIDQTGTTVQVYLDPGTPGPNEVHATFFDPQGTELPVMSVTMTIGPEGELPTTLVPRMLEPGHFVADTPLEAGKYLLTVSGPAPDGSGTLVARTDVEVSPQ
jgi:copper transport protein